MMLATPGLVLHATPYAESSVVAKVFTRQLGVRSYIVNGVRGARGRVKQNMLQPLTSLDMVVYDNHRTDLNYVKELSPRHPGQSSDPVANALRFFMTEVLYKTLREEEPMPQLWDYVEAQASLGGQQAAHVPIRFMLMVAHHLGIEPLDNHDLRHPCFDLQEGRFVPSPTETTLPPHLSAMLHEYLAAPSQPAASSLQDRTDLLNALIAYFQLHLSGFGNFHSHEILHTVLR
ncbi:MAG: recombination protein O N-terminal domain-containing protein [Bacteroidales bacterium]|nr:recombination protein O N-terminal domain-containing protein [Bacteroidales bacterium]